MEIKKELSVNEYIELVVNLIKDSKALKNKLFNGFFDTLPDDAKKDLKDTTFDSDFSKSYSSKEFGKGLFHKKADKYTYNIVITPGDIVIYKQKNNQKFKHPIYEKMTFYVRNLDNLLREKAQNTLIFSYTGGYEDKGAEIEPFETTVELTNKESTLAVQTEILNKKFGNLFFLTDEHAIYLRELKNNFAEEEKHEELPSTPFIF